MVRITDNYSTWRAGSQSGGIGLRDPEATVMHGHRDVTFGVPLCGSNGDGAYFRMLYAAQIFSSRTKSLPSATVGWVQLRLSSTPGRWLTN